MVQVREISVGVRQVKNLGNYQSLTAEATATVVLEDGDDPDMVYAHAWTKVKREVESQLKQA